MYQALKTHLLKYLSSEKEIEEFCHLFEVQQVKKKDYLLKYGEVCYFEAFVTKGLFKVYHLDYRGNEQILYFADEDWWLTNLDSFNNASPSQLYIQALEDSHILRISKENKEWAYQNIPNIERIFRIMTQKVYANLQRRMIDNLSKTAAERYTDFTSRYPKIAQRLTNIQIAGYLGVSHEFISKIRRKITKS